MTQCYLEDSPWGKKLRSVTSNKKKSGARSWSSVDFQLRSCVCVHVCHMCASVCVCEHVCERVLVCYACYMRARVCVCHMVCECVSHVCIYT